MKLAAIAALLIFSLLTAVAPAEAANSKSESESQKKSESKSEKESKTKSKSTIKWNVCNQEETEFTGLVYECASLRVPLDYNKPNRKIMSLALIRIPASDQENRKGALLLNPGGPGGSGVDFVLGAGPAFDFLLGPEISAQFDLVGFDPRGIAGSTPIRCFRNEEQAFETLPPSAFPLNKVETLPFTEASESLADSCLSRSQARRVGPHMSTANVARDMDFIREALGEDQLNFLGLSYGSYLGATYANLFPDRVRAMVVDGVLDPVAWVNAEAEVPFSTNIRSSEGAEETLQQFFELCDAAAPGNCALAPNSEERYGAVASRLRAAPLQLIDPETGETFPFTYQSFIDLSLGSLYSAFGLPFLALVVADIETMSSPQEVGDSVVALQSTFKGGKKTRAQDYDNFVEAFPAVSCVDTNNPPDISDWLTAGQQAEEVDGYFGPYWTWASYPCADWPFEDKDRYTGPFTAETANPVLIASTLYDPATRYEGAQALRSLMPNSALISADVPGHTTFGLSTCAGGIVAQYLLDPSIAPEVDGVVCPSEFNPFDLFAEPIPEMTDDAADESLVAARRANPDMAALMEARNSVTRELIPVGLSSVTD